MLMADVDVAVNVAVDAGVTTVASAPLSIFLVANAKDVVLASIQYVYPRSAP